MIANDILKADLLDILFEHRNKNYGAYVLRKYYANRLWYSLIFTLISAAVISFLVLNKKMQGSINNEPKKPKEVKLVDVVLPEQKKPLEPTLPRASPPAAKPPAAPNFIPVIVPDNIPIDRPVLETSLLNNTVPGPELTPGEPGGENTVATVGEKAKSNTEAENTNEKESAEIKDHADKMPEFPGGIEAWQRFLRRYLRVPDELRTGDKITVRVRFIVDKEGAISGFGFIESGGKSFNDEVLRVLKKMPKWKPGENKGHKVAVYFVQPITFVAAEE